MDRLQDLFNRGYAAYEDHEDFDRSRKLLTKFLKEVGEVDERYAREKVLALNTLGMIAQELGDLEKSKGYYWRMLNVSRNASDLEGHVLALLSLGALVCAATEQGVEPLEFDGKSYSHEYFLWQSLNAIDTASIETRREFKAAVAEYEPIILEALLAYPQPSEDRARIKERLKRVEK
ncbi:hypothetical protein [Streptosporangium sp. KLBMP 9127]|nr:hypothetical protein [Streptosporangium sp. KLBMP 9127]